MSEPVPRGEVEGELIPETVVLQYNTQQDDHQWVERCATASVLEMENVEELQSFFSSIGLFNFRLLPMGNHDS